MKFVCDISLNTAGSLWYAHFDGYFMMLPRVRNVFSVVIRARDSTDDITDEFKP